MHTPASLPFRQDKKYVPIERSVLDVQRALEDVRKQVVTVHAGPQLGKTSFVKHIALDIKERATKGMGTSFPDGVYYLSCGQKAKNKVEPLQLELLQGLGFGTPVPSDVTMAGGLQEELAARLRNKKLLIILDDLRDKKVLEEILVSSSPGVRYLVTSRNKDIWIPARKIELQRPTEEEADQILLNYIEGKLPDDIQTWSHSLVRMVEMHPKALANTGLSMSRNPHARNLRHWEHRVLKTRLVYGGKWFARIAWLISVCLLVENLVKMPNINRGVHTDPVYGVIIAAFFLLFSLHILPQITEYWGSVPGFKQNALVSSILGLPYGQKVILWFSFWGRVIACNLLGIAVQFDDHGALDVGTTWVSLTITRITLAVLLLSLVVYTYLIGVSMGCLSVDLRDEDVTANSLSATLSMGATIVDVMAAYIVLDTTIRRFR